MADRFFHHPESQQRLFRIAGLFELELAKNALGALTVLTRLADFGKSKRDGAAQIANRCPL